jgi:DtxR family Mn-dependent transcriptional regulator
LHRLQRQDLIAMDAHHVVELTPAGRVEAENIVRRHRLAERWLTDVLGFDWAKADEEANKLSHAFSPEVVERLSLLMGEPRTCPHGNPIPGNWPRPAYSGLRLDDAPLGVEVVVERVVEHAEVDAKLLRYLWGHGVVPGVHLTLLDKVPGAGTLTVRLRGQEVSLGIGAASKVQVRPVAAGEPILAR